MSDPEGSVPAAADDAPSRHRRRRTKRALAAGIGALILLILVLRYGGHVLVVDDPLPDHSDVAIVLFGGEDAVDARLSGAADLLRRGRVSNVMISVGAVRYYGVWLPDLVRDYVRHQYGADTARSVWICEGLADSTAEEMIYLEGCLRPEWESAVVVTSNFHTRRARLIVDATLARRTEVQRFAYFGVQDGNFRPDGWWRRRRYAKTWFLEMTKMMSFFVERVMPGGNL